MSEAFSPPPCGAEPIRPIKRIHTLTSEAFSPPPCGAAPDQRRNFLAKIAASILGGVLALVPLSPGLAFLIDPLRKRRKGNAEFQRVASLDSLPLGIPKRFPVMGTRIDAWSQYPQEPIGAVYLLRKSGDRREVVAFQVICPHAGCAVDFNMDGQKFKCPCHGSSFTKQGVVNKISARDLDTLEVRVEGDDVLVKYQEFMQGRKEKIPV